MTGEHSSGWNLMRVVRAYVRSIELIGIWGIAVITAVAAIQVFCRYVLNSSLFWSEEFMRYAMIWVVFMVAGLAYNRKEMLGFEMGVSLLPRRWRFLADIFTRIAIVIFLLVVAWYGTSMSLRTAVSPTPGLDIPMGFLMAAVPVGSLLLALHVIAGHFLSNDREVNLEHPEQ